MSVKPSSVIVSQTSTCLYENGVRGRHEHDGGGYERPEERAQADSDDRRASEGSDALGEPGVMGMLFGGRLVGVEAGFELVVHRLLRLQVQRLLDLFDIGLLPGLGYGIADHVRDTLLGRAGRQRELLVVADAALGVGQDAARVIDEAQRFLDIALPVAGLRVVLADEPAQRSAHVLVGGRGQDPELRRALPSCERGPHGRSIMPVECACVGPPKQSKKRAPGAETVSGKLGGAFRGSGGRRVTHVHGRTARPRSLGRTATAVRPAGHYLLPAVSSFSRMRADLPERARR